MFKLFVLLFKISSIQVFIMYGKDGRVRRCLKRRGWLEKPFISSRYSYNLLQQGFASLPCMNTYFVANEKYCKQYTILKITRARIVQPFMFVWVKSVPGIGLICSRHRYNLFQVQVQSVPDIGIICSRYRYNLFQVQV